MRLRLVWRLFAGYAAIILITATTIGVVIAARVQRDTTEGIRRTLRAEAILLRDIAAASLAGADSSDLQVRVRRLGEQSGTRLTVMREDGTVVADSRENPAAMDNHRSRPEVVEAAARGFGTSQRYSETRGQQMLYLASTVVQGAKSIGFVRTAVPLSDVEARIREVRNLVLMAALIGVTIALLFGFAFARGFTRLLAEMTGAARAVAAGDYSRHVPVGRDDEIGVLADALNTMTDRLREQIGALSSEGHKMHAILAGMVEGVIAVDRAERVLHVNAAAEAILGVGPTDVGRRLWEATRLREATDSVTASMEAEQVRITEARVSSPGGEQVIQLTATPLRDAAGGLGGAILVLHDVSELRKLEAVRRDFIANISHELKTPLAAIRGLVETLIDDTTMPAETHRRFIGKIRDQSERLSNLVVDLLTISRLESGDGGLQFAELDLRDPVVDAVAALALAARDAGLQVTSQLPDSPVRVRGDAESLRQMVENLVSNAVRYTPSGGRVGIELSERDGAAVLEVTDSGIGISPDHQGRIFERFYRVDSARSRQLGGTGLGLSIVKHVAFAHGGGVSLRSDLGQGSTFRVEIPR